MKRAQIETDRAWHRSATALLQAAAGEREVATRMHAIARALLGRPYRSNPLVGGPDTPEKLVLDLDGVDCVTLVESVLALARSTTPAEYAVELTDTRYRRGRIEWHERLHYFSDWMRWNAERGALTPRTQGPGSRRISTRLSTLKGLPPRHTEIDVVPRRALLKAADRIASGSVVAFASTRAQLDYFHVGLLFWEPRTSPNRDLLVLYHAARSAGRVGAEPLMRFLKRNRIRGLTFAAPRPRSRGGSR
jgi:hypothetical protein